MPGSAKGSLFVHARDFTRRRHGDAGWTALTGPLPAADRALLEGLILVGGWYPVGAWNRLVASSVKLWGVAEMREVAQHIGASDMNLLFKLILRLGSPQTVLGRSSSIYSRYFDNGGLAATPVADRRWRLQLRGATTEDDGPNEIMCNHGLPGWVGEALKLTGARARIDHTSCRFRGASECEYDVGW